MSRRSARPAPLVTSLLRGRVEHVRQTDVPRRFRYRTTTYVVDIDELDELTQRLAPWFGVDSRRIVTLRTDTHLVNEEGATMRERLDACLARHGRPSASGQVLLVANLAVFGYVFNPVSWWCCHDADGTLHTVISEVRNTFGESHTYAMAASGADAGEGGARDRWVRADHAKALHVSPFLPLELQYALAVRVPSPTFVDDEQCSFIVRVSQADGTPRFMGAQHGHRRAVTRRSLVATLLRHPLAPHAVTLRIHLQAVRLWVRRAPFFRKPPHVVHEGSVREEQLR